MGGARGDDGDVTDEHDEGDEDDKEEGFWAATEECWKGFSDRLILDPTALMLFLYVPSRSAISFIRSSRFFSCSSRFWRSISRTCFWGISGIGRGGCDFLPPPPPPPPPPPRFVVVVVVVVAVVAAAFGFFEVDKVDELEVADAAEAPKVDPRAVARPGGLPCCC